MTNTSDSLTFDDLVTAYFVASRWAHAAPELREYHVHKLEIMEREFGTSIVVNDPDRGKDRDVVARIIEQCLRDSAALSSPFGGRLEGAPGPIEWVLYKEHRKHFNDAKGALEASYRRIVRNALAALFPDATRCQLPISVLRDAGLPDVEPDPDDFW